MTWNYNIKFFITEEDNSMWNYINLVFINYPSKSIGIDISIVCITFFVWYIPEAKRLNIKNYWIFIILALGGALAFAYPLFLYIREIKLEKIAKKSSSN